MVRLDARSAAATGRRPISLLIVDDSLVVRTLLTRMLDQPAFAIAGAVASVNQALAVLDREKVDIILLDVEMPDTDGLTGLPELLRRGAGARILMVSALCDAGAAASVKAMTLGAVDTLLKPRAGGIGSRFRDQLTERLLRIGLAQSKAADRHSGAAAPTKTVPLRAPVSGPLDCIALGSSTGGLHALSAFFGALPASVSAPILITQHLPPSFMPYFAAQLAEVSGRRCSVAREGDRLVAGEMLVAPGDAHLTVLRSGSGLLVTLDQAPVPNGNMPSVDPMFETLAAAAAPSTIGIVLSGMGRDGERGAATLVAQGGELLAQDAESSVVWGMPGAVARAGLAALVGAPALLAQRVAARAERRAWS